MSAANPDVEIPESMGKTHHYRRECPSEHHKDLCKGDLHKMLVEDLGVNKIQETVRQNVENALKNITFPC